MIELQTKPMKKIYRYLNFQNKFRIYEKNSTVFRHIDASTINRNPPETIFQPQEIDNSISSNPFPPQSGGEEAESEKPDEISREPKVAGEESEGQEDENKSANEDTDAEGQN